MKSAFISFLLFLLPIQAIAQSELPFPQRLLGKGLIERKNTEGRRYLGLECVGYDSLGNLNCFKIRPVLIEVSTGKVLGQGNVFFISQQDPNAIQTEPTKKDIRTFMRQTLRLIDQPFPNSLGNQ